MTTPTVPPQICMTAAGCLIVDNQVLLVRHKKLGMWLNPGGHIEGIELPHQAAEREFFEETGLSVRCLSYPADVPSPSESDWYVPSPICTNVHWISRENYLRRVGSTSTIKVQKNAEGRRCEQHVCFLFLMELVNPSRKAASINLAEVTEYCWVKQAELDTISLVANVRYEVKKAFEITSGYSGG